MFSYGVFVHYPGRLGTAAAVPAAELLRRDGVFAQLALEGARVLHDPNRVMSHSFKCSRSSKHDPELKLPPPPYSIARRMGLPQ